MSIGHSLSHNDRTPTKLFHLILKSNNMKRGTPCTSHLLPLDITKPIHVCNYMKAVGSLNFLATWTRLDLAYTASVLSDYLSHPQLAHWLAVQDAYAYLNQTCDYCLSFGNHPTSVPTLQLNGYSHSDYAMDCHSSK